MDAHPRSRVRSVYLLSDRREASSAAVSSTVRLNTSLAYSDASSAMRPDPGCIDTGDKERAGEPWQHEKNKSKYRASWAAAEVSSERSPIQDHL